MLADYKRHHHDDMYTHDMQSASRLVMTGEHVVVHSVLPSLFITMILLAVLGCITLYCGSVVT